MDPQEHLRPQSLPRLRAKVAHEERLQQRASSATPTSLQQWCQVTSFSSFSLGAPLGLHYPQAAWVHPCGMYIRQCCLSISHELIYYHHLLASSPIRFEVSLHFWLGLCSSRNECSGPSQQC